MTAPKKQPDEARQGETGKGVRYILIISTVAAIALLVGVAIGMDIFSPSV